MRVPRSRLATLRPALLLCCHLAPFAAPTAAQAQWLAFPRGAEYRLPATGPGTTLRIPVHLSGVAWPRVALVVTDVHREGRGEEWMRAALDSLIKSPATGRGGPALLLDVAPSSLREAGTYTVEVEATAPGKALQRLQLRLTRPSAELNAPPVQIRREIPTQGNQNRWEGSLLIAEKSGVAAIKNISATPPLFAGRDGATLRFDDGNEGVAAGATARIAFRVDGLLPLGTAMGTIRLSSPHLAAPVDVPITIITHRSHRLLVGVIVAGLFLGWLVRTFLTDRIERNQLRVQADDVLLRIEDAAAAHDDANFGSAARALAEPLREARDRGNPETLATAITTANTGLRVAVEALQIRLDQARERTVVLARLARTEWNLPAGLALAISRARKILSDTAGALASGDAAGATRLLEGAEEGLRQAFGDALSTWPIERKAVLDALAVLPHGIREQAGAWIDVIRTDIEAVQPPEGEQVESLRSALATMHRARTRQETLTRKLGEWMAALAGQVVASLTRGTPDSAALAEFNTVIEAFRTHAAEPGQDADGALARLAADLHGVNRAFESVIGAHTPKHAVPEVQTLIAEKRYVEAAEGAGRAASPEGAVLRHGPRALEDGVAVPFTGAISEVDSPDAARSGPVPIPGIAIPESVRVHRARVLWRLILDQALLTLILGAAITIIGYHLYSPSFIGTTRELLTIFLWAFGLDVGVQALVSQSARLSAPVASAA